jgi:trimethylamine---corrinoid protein Co-methyltransferase
MISEHTGGVCLHFLTDAQVQTLHEASLRILERTGIRLEHEPAARMLADRGAKWDPKSRIVRLPPDLVSQAISTAPRQFCLYTRDAERAMPLSATSRLVHNSGGPAFIRDLETGERRAGRVQDVVDGAIVVDALPNVDCYTPLVSPGDVLPGAVEMEAFNAAVRHTVKPLVSAVISDREVRFLHRAYSVIAGSEQRLREKPMCTIGASPISPLMVSGEVSAAIMLAAQLAIPIRILPAPMLGGTAPMTLAGALAMQNAELLAGLTIAQTANPGCPVVLAPRLTVMDMRSGDGVIGAPEVSLTSACAAQLAHYCGLPVDAFALAGGGAGLDEQSGIEKAINAVVATLAGVNWLTGAGSIEAGKCSSLEQLVIDNEILSMIDHMLRPLEINEDTLALDVIDQVGPGGNFLGEPHTVKHLRTGQLYSSALGAGRPVPGENGNVMVLARSRVREILKTHQASPLSDDVARELDRLIASARKETEQR